MLKNGFLMRLVMTGSGIFFVPLYLEKKFIQNDNITLKKEQNG